MIEPRRHLRGLRARVPDARLFAPRVALALSVDGGRVLLDERGNLPALEIDIESSVRATAARLLASLSMSDPPELQLLAVHTGPTWFEQHDALGPLQPIWIVLGGDARARTGARALTPGEPPPLVTQPMDLSATPSRLPPDYIRTVRAGIGHDRIFYPWSGLALRDESGALFLVRLAEGEQWHCPGGGMEPGETPAARRSGSWPRRPDSSLVRGGSSAAGARTCAPSPMAIASRGSPRSSRARWSRASTAPTQPVRSIERAGTARTSYRRSSRRGIVVSGS